MSRKPEVSRRAFLSGAAIGAAGLAVAGVAGCSPAKTETEAEPEAAALDVEKYPALGDSRSNIDWLGTPPDLTPEDCAETIEADVIVIGAAVAGEIAGYAAVREGAKTIVIERNGTAHISGSGIGFCGAKYMYDNGLPEYDRYEMYQRIFNQVQGRCDQGLLASWIWHSGEVLDEMEKNVFQPGGIPGTASGALADESKKLEVMQNLASHVDFDADGNDNLEKFNNMVHKWIEDNGGEIHYNTTARVLTQDEDGTVTGVIAQKDDDGDYVYYKAANGVIVCTGSFGGNEDMMKAFANPWLARYAKEYGIYNARVTDTSPITTKEKMDDGTGHKMLCWAGAVMEQIDPSFQSWEGTGYWWWPFLHVDTKGNRFRNESSSWLDHTHLIAELPEGVNYYWQILPTNDFEMPSTLAPIPHTAWPVEEMGAEVYEADTIEELAEKIDIDPAVLRATVDRYNEICESGIDEDFSKLPKYLDPIDDPPYKAVRATCNFYATSSGVKIDRYARVLDKNWEPIPHLFAAGNTVGWRLGSGYQMTVGGLCNGWAFFHGYCAGRRAANPDWDFSMIEKD